MKKVLAIGIVFIIGFFIYVIYFKQSEVVSTFNILVIDKSDTNNQILDVSSQDANIEFKIKIEDENVWNLIQEDENYFVTIKYDGESPDDLPGNTTELQQINKLE